MPQLTTMLSMRIDLAAILAPFLSDDRHYVHVIPVAPHHSFELLKRFRHWCLNVCELFNEEFNELSVARVANRAA